MSRTILFIHGAWMTPLCWGPFSTFFAESGYDITVPAWPYHDRAVEELRAHPDPALNRLGLAQIIDHYAQIIQALPEPPIIIGHSFGGLITQVLLDRGYGAAGVALDPAPTRGIFAPGYLTTTKALLRIVATPGGWSHTFHWSRREFFYAFVNSFPRAEQERIFQEYVVPESGRIFWEGAFSFLNRKSPARVDFHNGQRAPLLIIAGKADHIVPASMVRANFHKYDQRSGAITDFLEFPKRTHWLIAQPGWDEIATSVDGWLRQRLPS